MKNETIPYLEDEFDSFQNTPLSELIENVAGEFVRIYRITDWVNIAFIRSDKVVRIEIEVSLASSACYKALYNRLDKTNLILNMMNHILYVKRLLEIDFDLHIIKEDCLWVASYKTNGRPHQDIFEAMVPPDVD